MACPGRRWGCMPLRETYAAGGLGLFLVARLNGEQPLGQTKRDLPHCGTRVTGSGKKKEKILLYIQTNLVGDKDFETIMVERCLRRVGEVLRQRNGFESKQSPCPPADATPREDERLQ
ncbi:unnamed protein product [Coccothraustes coccothraustes]